MDGWGGPRLVAAAPPAGSTARQSRLSAGSPGKPGVQSIVQLYGVGQIKRDHPVSDPAVIVRRQGPERRA